MTRDFGGRKGRSVERLLHGGRDGVLLLLSVSSGRAPVRIYVDYALTALNMIYPSWARCVCDVVVIAMHSHPALVMSTLVPDLMVTAAIRPGYTSLRADEGTRSVPGKVVATCFSGR